MTGRPPAALHLSIRFGSSRSTVSCATASRVKSRDEAAALRWSFVYYPSLLRCEGRGAHSWPLRPSSRPSGRVDEPESDALITMRALGENAMKPTPEIAIRRRPRSGALKCIRALGMNANDTMRPRWEPVSWTDATRWLYEPSSGTLGSERNGDPAPAVRRTDGI